MRVGILMLYLAMITVGCHSKSGNVVSSVTSAKSESAISYDLSKPVRSWELPDSLREVSGNAFVDADHLLMIEDLHPQLYLIRLEQKGVIEKQVPFLKEEDKKFDIEDVALSGDTAYALWSHGVVYQIAHWNSQAAVQRWETGLSKKNNTEGLCINPVTHQLLIACKNRGGEEDEKKSTRDVYQFDPASGKTGSEPFLRIQINDFKDAGYDVEHFYPSALAVHPQTKDIYILSTRETKAMAIYSYTGKLKSLQFIDKDLIPQPEGICFSKDGDLYISTEGKHGEGAKVMEFEKVR
jgi:uncharacterized protein YjiK